MASTSGKIFTRNLKAPVADFACWESGQPKGSKHCRQACPRGPINRASGRAELSNATWRRQKELQTTGQLQGKQFLGLKVEQADRQLQSALARQGTGEDRFCVRPILTTKNLEVRSLVAFTSRGTPSKGPAVRRHSHSCTPVKRPYALQVTGSYSLC